MENNSMHNITDAGKREKIFEGMGGGGGGELDRARRRRQILVNIGNKRYYDIIF